MTRQTRQLGRGVAGLLALALAACGAPSTTTPTPPESEPVSTAATNGPDPRQPALPAPKDTRLRGMILLSESGTFYRSKGDAEPVIARPPSPSPTQHSGKTLGAVRVVSEDSEWIEIETLPFASVFSEGYCQGPARIAGLGGAQVRLFVKRDALEHEVLQEPHELREGDGSVIRMLPGMLLIPTDEPGIYAFNLWGISGRVAVPSEKVGLSYEPPARHFERPKKPAYFAPPRGGPFEVHGVRPGSMFIEAVEMGSPTRLQITRDCFQVELEIPAPLQKKSLGGGLMLGSDPPDSHVAAGAELYWRGGLRAGQTVYPMPFDQLAEPDGARHCVKIMSDWRPGNSGIGGGQIPTAYAELCTDAAAVQAAKKSKKSEKSKKR